MNTVSIIVPIYNVESYLTRCLDSIINQTYRDLEIILVEDGSPDGCGRICDQYAQIDERIKVIHKANGGVSAARNDGLDAATGKYLTFVDPDDWCELNSIETMVNCLTENQVQLVYCGTFISSETSDRPNNMPIKEGVYDIEQTLPLHLFGGLASGLYRRLFIRDIVEEYNIRFDTSIRKAEDWLFYTQYLSRIKKEYILARPLYHYYQSTNSIIRTYYTETEKGLEKGRHIMESFERYLVDANVPEKLYRQPLTARYIDNILRYPVNIFDHRNTMGFAAKYKMVKYYTRHWAPYSKVNAFAPVGGGNS